MRRFKYLLVLYCYGKVGTCNVVVGDWGDVGFDIEVCRSSLMRYKSLEVATHLLGFGVVFFIAYRSVGVGCLNFVDVNFSVSVLIVNLII